jgi:hypothetical protein
VKMENILRMRNFAVDCLLIGPGVEPFSHGSLDVRQVRISIQTSHCPVLLWGETGSVVTGGGGGSSRLK